MSNATAGGTYNISHTNAGWLIVGSYITFTMQTGFALLHSGSVSKKNEVSKMFAIIIALVFVGLAYWIIGYGLAFGDDVFSNIFCGYGRWALVKMGGDESASYTFFSFQITFASTTSTIVSGASAERLNVFSYACFTLFNMVTFVILEHWVWSPAGWLHQLGAIDIAGAGVIHVCGGSSAFIMTIMLGPRRGRYEAGVKQPPITNGQNMLLGLFFLWWSFLGLICGCVYAHNNETWIWAARAAINMSVASIAGGCSGIIYSILLHKVKLFDLRHLINGILGAVVAISASCAVVLTGEAFVIGAIGGILASLLQRVLDRFQIDDAVGAVPVHACAGSWGLIAVAFFAKDRGSGLMVNPKVGVFHGNDYRLLAIQILLLLTIILFSMIMTYAFCLLLRCSPLGLRVSSAVEDAGFDYCFHGIGEPNNTLLEGLDMGERFQLEHRGSLGNIGPLLGRYPVTIPGNLVSPTDGCSQSSDQEPDITLGVSLSAFTNEPSEKELTSEYITHQSSVTIDDFLPFLALHPDTSKSKVPTATVSVQTEDIQVTTEAHSSQSEHLGMNNHGILILRKSAVSSSSI